MRFSYLALVLAAGCGSNSSSTVDAPRAIDAAKQIDATVFDAPPDGTPNDQIISLAGGANALLWDAASSTLFLTNGNADTLLKYTDANGIQTVATLPPETAGISLGGMVEQADHSILIANFGFGTQGTLFAESTGTATALTGMDGTRRRIGLAADSAGVLYTSYFTKSGSVQVGGVATATIDGTGVVTETEIAGASTTANFGKIVGVVATPTNVYVSQQDTAVPANNKIFQVALPGLALTTLATLPTSDLLFMMPNGDILCGGGPVISRVTQAGVVSALPNTGFETAHGLAFDPAGHRLFIIDHSSTVGVADRLHIQPLAN
jgi:hypothetical protein